MEKLNLKFTAITSEFGHSTFRPWRREHSWNHLRKTRLLRKKAPSVGSMFCNKWNLNKICFLVGRKKLITDRQININEVIEAWENTKKDIIYTSTWIYRMHTLICNHRRQMVLGDDGSEKLRERKKERKQQVETWGRWNSRSWREFHGCNVHDH